jgi:hypothetical protein
LEHRTSEGWANNEIAMARESPEKASRTRLPANPQSALGSPQLSRARAFLSMNKEEQVAYITERFKEVDSIELTTIVKAIYGHLRDMN